MTWSIRKGERFQEFIATPYQQLTINTNRLLYHRINKIQKVVLIQREMMTLKTLILNYKLPNNLDLNFYKLLINKMVKSKLKKILKNKGIKALMRYFKLLRKVLIHNGYLVEIHKLKMWKLLTKMIFCLKLRRLKKEGRID